MAKEYGFPGPSFITVRSMNSKFDSTGSIQNAKGADSSEMQSSINKEQSGDCFSTDGMKTSILDIQNEAINQKRVLLCLKQKRIDLENDIKKKVAELNRAKEEQLLLEGQLQSSELRLEELQKHSSESEGHIAELRQSARDVLNSCSKEKEIQLKQLRDYEAHMADLSQKVSSAPRLYDQEMLATELSMLRAERASIHEELVAIEKDMNDLRTQLANLMSRSNEFPSCSGSILDLSKALRLILSESRSSLCEAENENCRLEQEIKNLQQVASELQAETKGRGHNLAINFVE
ncbi:peptidoglycan DL-endopeptidase CwlO isoform X1 [Anabrus simplex]|uniref:peptidoglycan DL-endopeptidase CwlO isoform X1 n=2 Tax=Anabrus simplex TaxID=316456 RepID=UPI0034DD983C